MSGAGFNLLDDRWIPFGGRMVSIEEALLEAHDLPGWPDGDPGLAEVLTRLLVPMAYRITGLDDTALTRQQFLSRQQQLLSAGPLDPERVRAYVASHHSRFWLLNPPPRRDLVRAGRVSGSGRSPRGIQGHAVVGLWQQPGPRPACPPRGGRPRHRRTPGPNPACLRVGRTPHQTPGPHRGKASTFTAPSGAPCPSTRSAPPWRPRSSVTPSPSLETAPISASPSGRYRPQAARLPDPASARDCWSRLLAARTRRCCCTPADLTDP